MVSANAPCTSTSVGIDCAAAGDTPTDSTAASASTHIAVKVRILRILMADLLVWEVFGYSHAGWTRQFRSAQPRLSRASPETHTSADIDVHVGQSIAQS
ncbi:hypothetical protein RE943_38050 [Prescottella equi]|nr:hypothetical protein RE9425_39390 [Prescottella equi]BCN70332.1 hypothetical protein RE943_38050 [Prescottella equi]BCN85259.1 hypothetical protein RE0356_39000 [Prescottella equi]BDC74049.1 hypothetical protein KAREA_39640 [Prescottella equi]